MRSINYRAWDVQNKKYVTITYIFFMGDGEIEIDYLENLKEPRKVRDEEIILEQYTGCKDKNGKEIYEGDLLKRENHDYIYTVKWWKEGCGFNLAWVWESIIKGYKIEVIGNIHENPELLKWTENEVNNED